MASIFDRDELNDSLFFPRPDASAAPAGAEDRFVEVPGGRIHVRCHASPGARCTLLLFHGNGEVVADYDDAVDDYAAAGAALAIADFRGYGRSSGTPTLRTLVSDARTIAAAVPGAPLIVMGRSLGGVVAHELFAQPTERLAGVVLESAFFDLGNLVRRRGMVPPAVFAAEDLAAFDPAPKLARGQLPLLVLHGARDETIDPREAVAAHAAATGTPDRQLVFVPGRGHNDLSRSDVYWGALRDFVARVAG